MEEEQCESSHCSSSKNRQSVKNVVLTYTLSLIAQDCTCAALCGSEGRWRVMSETTHVLQEQHGVYLHAARGKFTLGHVNLYNQSSTQEKVIKSSMQ